MLTLPRRGPADPGRRPLRPPHWGLRRLASAGLAAGALAAALHVLAPEPARGLPVVVAAHDIAAGSVLTGSDVRPGDRPRADRPDGALDATRLVVGRVAAGAVRSGEVLTDARLAGPGLLAGATGEVAAPLRVADVGAADLVEPGDRVDVLLAVEGAARAQVVVRSATVLARPTPSGDDGSLLGGGPDPAAGGLLVLEVGEDDAAALAGAAARGPLSLVLRAGPGVR